MTIQPQSQFKLGAAQYIIHTPPKQKPHNRKTKLNFVTNFLHDVTKFGIGLFKAYSHKIICRNGLKYDNTAPSHCSNWGLHNNNPPNQIPTDPKKQIELPNNILHDVTKFGIGFKQAYSHKIKGQNGLKHENTAPSHSSNWGLHNYNPPKQIPTDPKKQIEIRNNVLHDVTNSE